MTRHGIMRRFARAEDGAILVEFAILDFGGLPTTRPEQDIVRTPLTNRGQKDK